MVAKETMVQRENEGSGNVFIFYVLLNSLPTPDTPHHGLVWFNRRALSVGRSSIEWSCDNNVPVGEPVVVTIPVSAAGLALDSCKHCWVKIVGWSLKEILFPCSCYVMTGLHMSFSQVTFIALLSTVKTSSCPLCLCWSLS